MIKWSIPILEEIMKKKLFYLMSLALSVLLLVACAGTSKKTSSGQKTKTTTASTVEKKVVLKDFKASSGAFSIQAPDNWETKTDIMRILNKGSNDIAIGSARNDAFLSATRFEKADIAIALKDFAPYAINHSKAHNALKNAKFAEASIAGKKGFLSETTVNENGNQHYVKMFFYEEGNYYKYISSEALKDDKESASKNMETTITSWKDSTVKATYDLTSSVSLPNSQMTITLPSAWVEGKKENAQEKTMTYQSLSQDKSLTLFTQPTAGYTVDIPTYVNRYASEVSQNANVQEVIVGQHQGYLIQFTEVSDTAWNVAINIYVFHINETVVNFIFATSVSEQEPFRPTMEAIINSLK